MNGIENILNKIKQDYEKKVSSIKQEFENKKNELKKKYELMLSQEKEKIKKEYEQRLNSEKMAYATEKFVEFNKEVELLKRQLLTRVFNEVIQEIISLPKEEYYKFIKSLIVQNIFFTEKNFVLFDNTGKLSLVDKQKLIKEVLEKLHQEGYKNVEIEILNDVSQQEKIDFGIKIFSGKRTKDCSLETLVDTLKPDLEIEISKILFE